MSDARDAIERLEAAQHARLERHRGRIYPVRVLAARPRLLIAIAAGAVAALVCPGWLGPVSRALVGWNVFVVCYLALVIFSIFDAGPRRMRLQAQLLDDGRFLVLAFSVLSAVAAIGAIAAEFVGANDLHGAAKTVRLVLAASTIVSSWAFIHMVFALHYAHEFYQERLLSGADALSDLDRDGDVDDDDAQIAAQTTNDPRGGLIFPGSPQPTYVDFAYFSYIIGVASQTADVEISTREMRRVSLAHSILAFFFNTAILALSVNLAAGLFQGQ